MPTNAANTIGGPCLIQYNGSTFRSKGDVALPLSLETFAVQNDLYGDVDERVANQPVKLSFTPEGRFADLDVLHPYVNANKGDLITPRYACGAVVHGDDTIAVAATTLAVGTPVSFGTTGTMPTGLTAATLYYLGVNVGGVRKVYPTAADAVADTNVVALTGNGTGDLAFVIQRPLVITGNDGKRYTFHNAAITKQPNLNLGSLVTIWDEVEFECFPKNGVAWSTANSLVTIDTATFSDSGFDPAEIITQPYSFTWGSAPWADLYTKSGFKIENTLALEAEDDDASGVYTRRFASLSYTAKAQPNGPSLSDLITALTLQGSGSTRGRSLAGDNLNIVGTDVYVRLYAAALIGGAANWSSKLNRMGELTWKATRTFTGGAANPLFYIGAAAPV